MKFLGIAHVGPGILADFLDRRGVQAADIRGDGFGEYAPHFDGARAALLQRRIVQIGKWIRVENFVRELRGHGRIDSHTSNASIENLWQEIRQAFQVHCFRKRVLHHLANQRMVRNLRFT